MSNLGEMILTKTLTGLCEGGQCGGEVTLTTDVVREAYAVVEPERGGKFVEQDCDGIEKRRDGSIVVACAAYDVVAEERCNGYATFTKAMLNDEAWTAPGDEADAMHPMDTED